MHTNLKMATFLLNPLLHPLGKLPVFVNFCRILSSLFIRYYRINQAFSCSQIEKIETLWYYDYTKVKLKAGEKLDSDGTDRPEASRRFTETKRFSPA